MGYKKSLFVSSDYVIVLVMYQKRKGNFKWQKIIKFMINS